MNSVREHIRAVIGPPRASGITDKEIDDASWEYYFDLDQTMDYVIGLYIATQHTQSDPRRNEEQTRCCKGETR